MTIINLVAPKAGAKQELLFNKPATVFAPDSSPTGLAAKMCSNSNEQLLYFRILCTSTSVCFWAAYIQEPIYKKGNALDWLLPAVDKRSSLVANSVACTINIYDRRFYDRKLCSSLERKLQSYDHNPS
jgi:hypothetical protein